mmetsp:Transcript_43406/g.142478  ORF Transcript_43406/g.142478 Transcript_43406/m.142478 type:complete len:574 (+) Transcript_43406:416-2137(+)
MRPLPADARRRPPRHVALPRPSRPLLLRRRLCFRRRTSARASCLRSAAGEARLRADAAGRNCARTHLFRRQLARCPHPTLCGGGILHGRRGGAASRTRRAGGGVGVPRGRRLVRDHVAVDGHAFPVRPLQAALPRLRLPRGASPRGRYQGEAAAKVRQRRRGARAVSRRHGAGAAAFGRMRARLQVELARRRAHRAVLARCRRPAHVGSVLSLGEPADHPGKGQAAPRVGRGWAYFATRLLSPRGPGVAVAPRGDERRAARWHVLRFRPSRPPAVCRARREQPRHSLSRPRLFRFPLLVLALGRRPVRRAAGDRVRGGRRGERHRFCAALCGGRLSRGRRPRRRWVARSCAVWRAIRRAHGDGAVAVRQLWRWRRRWRRCCFFPIASHSLLFCAGARRLLVALEVAIAPALCPRRQRLRRIGLDVGWGGEGGRRRGRRRDATFAWSPRCTDAATGTSLTCAGVILAGGQTVRNLTLFVRVLAGTAAGALTDVAPPLGVRLRVLRRRDSPVFLTGDAAPRGPGALSLPAIEPRPLAIVLEHDCGGGGGKSSPQAKERSGAALATLRAHGPPPIG